MKMTSFKIVSALSAVVLLVGLPLTNNGPPNESNLSTNSNSRKLDVPFADQLPDREISSNLMKLSLVISKSDEEIQNALPPNFTLQSYLDVVYTGTQAALVTNEVDGYAAIVFRSSEVDGLNDWLTNFSVKQVSPQQLPGAAGSEVKVHHGFQRAVISNGVAEDFAEQVMELLNDSSLGLTKVYITGHSLGGEFKKKSFTFASNQMFECVSTPVSFAIFCCRTGALSHIMGVYLASNYSDNEFNVVNFGAPRVGNEAFKTWTEQSLSNLSVWRFVFRADIVPRVLMHDYDHAGHLFQVWSKKSEMFYSQVGEDDYKGVPGSWHCTYDLLLFGFVYLNVILLTLLSGHSFKDGHNTNHHQESKYNNFFQNKAHQSQFWPTSFAMVPECKWWQAWC